MPRSFPILACALVTLAAACTNMEFLGREPRWFGPSDRLGMPEEGSPEVASDPTPRGVLNPSISQAEMLFPFGYWPTDRLRRSRELEIEIEQRIGLRRPYPDPRFALGYGHHRLRYRIGPAVGLGLDQRLQEDDVLEGQGFALDLPVSMVTAALVLELPLQEYRDIARLELQLGLAVGFSAAELRFDDQDHATYVWLGVHMPW